MKRLLLTLAALLAVPVWLSAQGTAIAGGATLPATCRPSSGSTPGTPGHTFIKSGTAPGVYWCDSTNHWAGPLISVSAITALTGDVTATGPGSVAATIAANAVTNAKMATMATLTLKANLTGGSAVPTDSTLSAILDAILSSTQGAIIYRGSSVWTALAPGTSSQYLKSGGASANVSWNTPTGSGDFVGPSSAVDSDLVCFDGTTGKLGKDCGAIPTYTPTGGVDELDYYKGSGDNLFHPLGLSPFFTLISGTLGAKINAAYSWVAAAAQDTTDSLAFNCQSSGCASASHVGTTVIVPTADFVDGATSEIQFHFPIPKDWDGAAMSLEGKWKTAATSGSITWSVEGKCSADGSTDPTSYNGTPDDSGADTAKGTTLQENDFTVAMSVASGHTLSGCAAKGEWFGRISTTNALGGGNAAKLLSFVIYFSRPQ